MDKHHPMAKCSHAGDGVLYFLKYQKTVYRKGQMRFSTDSEWIKNNPDDVVKYVHELHGYWNESIQCLVRISRSNLECLELLQSVGSIESDVVKSVMNSLAEKTRMAMKLIDEYYEY